MTSIAHGYSDPYAGWAPCIMTRTHAEYKLSAAVRAQTQMSTEDIVRDVTLTAEGYVDGYGRPVDVHGNPIPCFCGEAHRREDHPIGGDE